MVKLEYFKGAKKYKVNIPTSLSEITIEKYLAIYNLSLSGVDDIKIYLEELAGIPVEHSENFPNGVITSINDTLLFLKETDIVTVKDFKGYSFDPVGALKVIQFEHWKERLHKIMDWDLMLPYTVSLLHSGDYYYSKRMDLIPIMRLPADIGIYCRNFYNIYFTEHIKKFAPLYDEGGMDAEQIEAGAEQLSEWGFYATLHSLSGGDLLKKEKIASMSVDDVYTHLSYSKQESVYLKNYAVQRTGK